MKQTILLVDDDPDDIELTTLAIEQCKLGLSVHTAMTGPAALDYLHDGNKLPSLILLDLKMPGMNGFDFLREIRADANLKNLPVIVVTSSNLDSDKSEAVKAGANDFLHKSFQMSRFCGELQMILERWLPKQ